MDSIFFHTFTHANKIKPADVGQKTRLAGKREKNGKRQKNDFVTKKACEWEKVQQLSKSPKSKYKKS
jgi:hypothetical protein